MAQFVVRNLEDDVKTRLQRRAKRHGRSMEEEVRQILRKAATEDQRPVRKLGTAMAARFSKIGLKEHLPEVGGPTRPAVFGK